MTDELFNKERLRNQTQSQIPDRICHSQSFQKLLIIIDLATVLINMALFPNL